MPGLWDVHIHPDYLSLDEMPLADQVTLFGHRLATALTESGIVGLRCAGAHHFMDVAWKRAFDSGQHVGPRLFASGYFLTTTGGHFLTSGHALEVDGPYGWVKAIREQIASAVDLIVHQNRLKDGSRKIVNITEVQGMEGDVIVMQDIFVFEQTAVVEGKIQGRLRPTGIRPKFVEKFDASGIHLPPNVFGSPF